MAGQGSGRRSTPGSVAHATPPPRLLARGHVRAVRAFLTTYATTLAAISAGAVFMGANTYIGNAPNLMVKAIAEERGIRMPSFFGYMGWACVVLLPLFVVMTFIFFR